jgi:predicted ATP-binding protein involved in virulence
LNQWLLHQDWESYQRGKEDAGFALVKRAILHCLPGAKEIRFSPSRKEAVVAFEQGSEQPFSNLSDGQRNVLALVGDLAVKVVKLNFNELGDESIIKTPGVVLIDEIDIHLHPNWQRVVLEHLRTTFPNLQFVATTHSPFIVQALREGELISLERQTIPEVGNRGINEISKGLMGVNHPETSGRYQAMKAAAKTYLLTLEEAAKAPEQKLQEYLDRLSQGIDQFADNPAYQAFLELKREGRLGPKLKQDTKE